MLISVISDLSKKKSADVLVYPFWQHKGEAKEAFFKKNKSKSFSCVAINNGDFIGESGEVFSFYKESSSKNEECRIILVGLGEENQLTIEIIRRAFGNVIQICKKKRWRTLNIVLPAISLLKTMNSEELVKSVLEGLLSANYIPKKYGNFAKNKKNPLLIEQVTLIGIVPKLVEKLIEREQALFKGVFLARDLVNGNADDVNPQYLVKVANELKKECSDLKLSVLSEKEILEKKMGLFSAVARGASCPPNLIIFEYKGAPRSKDVTLLVGKGVTYDTGGLDLKPGPSMLTMKTDMAGAAVVLGCMTAISSLKLKLNVIGVIPATENSIDALSYKMGDVYVGYSGDSVEIGSTDAEGRLILADAMAYAIDKYKPTRVIDFATLTGAIVVALGTEIAGMFSNNDVLASMLMDAGNETGELLCKIPLHSPYKKTLKSEIADLKNIGSRGAGSITAALFLEHFVKKTPWAHIDIAGTAYLEEEDSYKTKLASGFGVRLAVSFLQNLLSSKD